LLPTDQDFLSKIITQLKMGIRKYFMFWTSLLASYWLHVLSIGIPCLFY